MKTAPVLLFVYTKLDSLKKTITSLQKNDLATFTDLFIYSDAAKDVTDQLKVEQVRNYIQSISGFRKISIICQESNLGLSRSVILGVSKVLRDFEEVIVLEDDLILSSNFLHYMNEGLSFYKQNDKILSICGYSPPLKINLIQDIYFTKRSSSWGWATWSDRWEKVDWECKLYKSFKFNLFQIIRFNKMGSDLSWMLWKQMHGLINSWAIRFCFHQFNYGLYSIHPTISKVQNIGVGDLNATNTNGLFSRFETTLDEGEKRDFLFTNDSRLNHDLIKQFVKPNSFIERFKSKLI